MSLPLLEISGLRKEFTGPDGARACVLQIPAFELAAGAQVGLRGASGSGKTTLLNLIAGILRADAGTIRFDGRELAAMSEVERDGFRAQNIGFVFQGFHLLPAYSALENVLLGMTFGKGADAAEARRLLERVGLAERLGHRPAQLSAGQQQRVALARALANRPRLVLADEPTGNLDARAKGEALTLMREICRESGAALLLASHDSEALACFDSVRTMEQLNEGSRK